VSSPVCCYCLSVPLPFLFTRPENITNLQSMVRSHWIVCVMFHFALSAASSLLIEICGCTENE